MARRAKKSDLAAVAVEIAAGRRPNLTLFTRATCVNSHRVRMVLAEKGIECDLVWADGDELPDDLAELNPYGTVPTLVDRGLVLYEPRIIMEYLDERFPHPPLMPIDPVARAHTRMATARVEQDWYELAGDLEGRSERQAEKARKRLSESLVASSELFGERSFFLSDEFSLLDCAVLPVLWRLERWGVSLPPAAARAVARYTDRMFKRPTFIFSMTELEREMRA